jgi:hypothetical protein
VSDCCPSCAREQIIGLIAGNSTDSLRTRAAKVADGILAIHTRELAAPQQAIMFPVTDYTALVAAAAQAAGPAPAHGADPGRWLANVQNLAVELAFAAREVEQRMQTLDASHPFAAFLEKVEIEESSRRGLLTLLPPSGVPETIRTQQDTTIPGRQMIERAQALVGRWVLVYRANEPKAGTKFDNVRMVVRLVDQGEGTLSNEVARQLLIGDAGGDQARAQQAWREAGLPLQGLIPVADLEPVRRKVRGEQV